MLTAAQLEAVPERVLVLFERLDAQMRGQAAAEVVNFTVADRAALRSSLAATSRTAQRSILRAVSASVTRAASASLSYDERIYRSARVAGLLGPYVPVAESARVAQIVELGIMQVSDIMNFVRTSAEQRVYQTFVDALDAAALRVATGTSPLDSAVRDAVAHIAETETRVIYTSATGQRVEQGLYGAVRRAVLTGANQTTLRAADARAEELGAEYVEITAHFACRPEHVDWQGTVIALAELAQVTGYGTVTGLGGAN